MKKHILLFALLWLISGAMFGQETFVITVLANPTNGGAPYIGNTPGTTQATFTQGQSCTVHANLANGYSFQKWTVNGNQVSTYANFTFTVNDDCTLVANYTPLPFTISVSADPSNGGTVTGGGGYNYGDNCTLRATANSGFAFENWTENGSVVSTYAEYQFIVTGNRTLVAHFTALPPNIYTIIVSANPNNGGSPYIGNTPGTTQANFTSGQQCTVHANPNQGYTFLRWTENGTQVSANANYTFTVTSNRNLVAHYQAQQQTYIITVSASPTNGGTVTGGGTYQLGELCTVTATPASGYTFLRWRENGNEVSTNPIYQFTVTGNRTLVANFQAQAPNTYTISVSADPANGGSPYIGNTPGTTQATFTHGQSCTVHANPANGYEFANWTVNGGQVSTNANYTFTVTSNRSLVAHFTAQAPNTYTITATTDPANGGSVTGGGTYEQGTTCTLTATPNTNAGYEFVNWTKNGQQVSTNTTYSFLVTESAAYVAHFRLKSFTINVSADPSNGGTVSGSGTYEYGITCIVSATPKAGFSFTNWTENGNVVSTQANYQFTVTSNRTLVAHFTAQAPNTYTITVSANPTSGGSPYVGNIPGTTQATFASGLYCTVHANPINGYTFTNWTENGQMIPNVGANYTFIVTSNRNLVAHYQTGPTDYSIITDVIPTGSGIVTGGGTYSSGAQATLTAIANEGYTFEHWQDGNTDNPRSITVTGNATYTAYFTLLPQYTITATADPDEGGIVEGGGQYYLGATCSLHASANEGYYFVNWTKDGSDFSDLPDTSFVVTENAIYEAHFFQGSGGYTISVRANPEEGGNVTGSGTYVQDIPITLIATPNEGYEFTNWTENGVIQCLTNRYEFVVDRNRVLIANFEQLPVFTISASAGENGSIDPQGDIQVVKGSDITFSIRPDFGFRITSVMVDGNNTGQADTYTFTNVDCNHTIYVSFNGWGIEDDNAAEVKVYPNPANDKVHVEGEGIESVALFDLLGNCLRNMDFNTSNTLNVSGLSKGIYVLMLTTQDGRIGYQKLIIAK